MNSTADELTGETTKHRRDPDMESGFAPRGYRNERRGTSLTLARSDRAQGQTPEPHEGED